MFVLLRIKVGIIVLKDWFGTSISEVNSFMDVFNLFSSGEIDKAGPISEEFNTWRIDVAGKK